MTYLSQQRWPAWTFSAASIAVVAGASSTSLAVDTIFDNGAGTGLWNNDTNWAQAGGNGTFGDGDDVNAQPGTGDAAIINAPYTVTLDSSETVLELQVSYPNHVSTPATGIARLNITTGAALTTNGNSSGIRVGRQLAAGQVAGSSRGEIVQTGGSVVIQQGSNGLRLSQADAGTTVADSYYELSGGSLRGGAGANGTMVSNLAIGTITNTYNRAEFHINGSGATDARFLDIALGGSRVSDGEAVIHFSIDAGGVTTLVAEDELQFRGSSETISNAILEIDLIGLAPEADIVLILADRLNTNGVTNSPSLEAFTNFTEGASIVRQFGGYEYTWLLDYTDGGDDGVLDASIVLDFVSRTEIPEPASLILLGLGGLMIARHPRR